ncbi:MAG: WYL domain-containing protein [Ruminococcaceae bacterium]|nr:WYL domain-containing protein [Oscillospiraceae bacterium]
MARTEGQKLKLLYLMEIFKKYSDEEHPLTTPQIIEHLAKHGIEAERKSIYRDIDVLIDYGFDIVKNRGNGGGFFLFSREFEVPEIKLLTDAVQAASFITAKKSRELTQKLDEMLSVYEAKKQKGYSYIDISHKCKNEEIYYTIDNLSRAIEKRVKVQFKYVRRRLKDNRTVCMDEKIITVSPYALLWQDDSYYLVCNNEKYDNLMNLRLDRMRSVALLSEPFRHFKEVSEYKESFDIADYAAKSFNMFCGEPTKIKLRCERELLEQAIDRFGEDIFIYNVQENTFDFDVNANLSDGLVSWILQFGKSVEAVEPQSLREMIKNRLSDLNELYK